MIISNLKTCWLFSVALQRMRSISRSWFHSRLRWICLLSFDSQYLHLFALSRLQQKRLSGVKFCWFETIINRAKWLSPKKSYHQAQMKWLRWQRSDPDVWTTRWTEKLLNSIDFVRFPLLVLLCSRKIILSWKKANKPSDFCLSSIEKFISFCLVPGPSWTLTTKRVLSHFLLSCSYNWAISRADLFLLLGFSLAL